MSGRHELRRLLANPALIIGLIGTLALLGMGVWGAVIAPYDPNANLSMVIKHLPDGTISFKVPPTFPDSDHVFGTDALGRDQWSRLLTGAWLSLSIVVAAAVLRLGIGFSLGITSGWYGGPFARLVRIVAAGITAVPQLLLAIMLVLVTRPLGVAGFIASLALVGWPEIVNTCARRYSARKRNPSWKPHGPRACPAGGSSPLIWQRQSVRSF